MMLMKRLLLIKIVAVIGGKNYILSRQEANESQTNKMLLEKKEIPEGL